MLRYLAPLLLISELAQAADCYTRSSSVAKQQSAITRITDLEKTILPENKGLSKCRVTFRALIDNTWYTAEGEATGHANNTDQICAFAVQNGRVKILEKVGATTLTANQELICTDQKIPETKPLVKIGDTIRESEVRVHPVYPNAFLYRGSQCRWFVESVPQAGKFDANQGIICNSPGQMVWSVVDKW